MRSLGFLALALLASPAFAQTTTLPGGASSLSEKHGDWLVNCSVTDRGKGCGFSQAAAGPAGGGALAAMELGAPAAGRAEGMLLTAFGLRFDAGIKLELDGQPLGTALPFLSCIQTGCLVPVAFDEAALNALKAGTKLDITGVKVTDGQPVTASMSLVGFTAAYDRTVELVK
jgi:invasion protein IalB